MMYYTTEARKSAITEIRRIISQINEIPGDHLDYISATKATNYLNDLIRAIDNEELTSLQKAKASRKNKRLTEIYVAAVEFVEGVKPMMSTQDVFEIMREGNEYTVSEICYVVDKLYADGFIRK